MRKRPHGRKVCTQEDYIRPIINTGNLGVE